jgi:TRAP transporter TAXI family solute receptor
MERPGIAPVLGFAAVLLSAGVGPTPPAFAADVLVGTGSTEEAHFAVGRAICRQLEKSAAGMSCEAFAIEGRDAAEPLAVLSAVRTGTIEIGIVTSDWQHHAVQGSGPVEFMDVSFDNLRSLFSLHGEPFTLVARRDSGIDKLDDLAGKRVNIGNPGSDQRAVMDLVMAAKGWTRKSFRLSDELSESEQSLALCHDRVQAMVSTVAHPDAALSKTIELCNAKVVEVTGPEIEGLMGAHPYFGATEVPPGHYAGMTAPARTFGVRVTVIASTDLDDELSYSVTQAVFDNLDAFKRTHPALGSLMPERMMKDGLAAPIHPGALRYFQERGMM